MPTDRPEVSYETVRRVLRQRRIFQMKITINRLIKCNHTPIKNKYLFEEDISCFLMNLQAPKD